MRQVYKNIGMALAGITLLFGCKGDGTLLDLYPKDPIVNPEVGMLIQNNRFIQARLDGQQISGITQNGSFSTTNRFRSFDFESSPWQVEQGAVSFGNGLIVHAPSDGLSFSLRYSTDDGVTWAVYDKPIVDGDDLAAGGVSVNQLLVSSDRVVWLLCQQQIAADRRVLLYRVDLDATRSEKVCSIARATAWTVDFLDSEKGWLLYARQDEPQSRIHILKTIDGGRAWSAGAVLDGVEDPAIALVDTNTLLVYNPAGQALRSADGGATFASVTIGRGGISLCQAAPGNIVYALLASGLAKSTDGGQTWIALDAEAHGVEVSGWGMHFTNEGQGIVYADDKLFVTDNAGDSWDILVYPYDYVFN